MSQGKFEHIITENDKELRIRELLKRNFGFFVQADEEAEGKRLRPAERCAGQNE